VATQRRSWLARTGVVLAISFGALVGVTTPAFAAASVVSANLNPNTINVGQESVFRFKLKENTPNATKIDNIQVAVGGSGTCTENCGSFDANVNQQGETDTLSVKIKGNSQGQAQVRITVNGTPIGNSYNLAINQPQQQAETTGRLQGEVKDISNGKGISGATVTLTDGNNRSFSQKTNSAGTYTFDGPSLKIAPGLIVITAIKDPLVLPDGPKSIQVNPGQSITLPALNMQAPTASAPPTTAAPEPSLDPSGSAAPPAGAIDTKSDDKGLDSMTWIMIIVGGVLVALGIGAIVLLLVRRNNDDEEEGDEDDQPVRGRPGPRGPQPGYRPPPQPTQQYGGAGYGRGADPTMMARPGMNEAPTMMHRPDAYGAQPTQQYGGQGWAPPQQPGYGAPASGPGYGQQSSGGGGYGSQASGGGAYGGQASGGGAYGGQASGGGAYGGQGGQASGGGYGGGQQPGYGAGQYDEPTAYAGGAGAGGGYDQSGYGSGQGGGYDQQGYGQQGYGQSDQHGQQGHQQDPYGQQGYSDDRRNRGDRRLDWLDD